MRSSSDTGAPVNAPGAPYLVTAPNVSTSDNGVGKFDAHLNDKQTLNGMLFVGYYGALGVDHATTNDPAFLNPVTIRTWTNTESWVWVPNSKFVNEVRFGYNRFTFLFTQNDAAKAADGSGLTGGSEPINPGVTGLAAGGLPRSISELTGGFATLGSWRVGPPKHAEFHTTSGESLYLSGKHALKFGGEAMHIAADATNYNLARGRIFFTSGQCFNGSLRLDDFFCGTPQRAQLTVGDPVREMRWMDYAGYVQDDWHVTPKVTANLGIRYEYKQPIKEVNGLWGNFDPTSPYGLVQQGKNGLDSIYQPDRTNFGPRIGLAWDVTGKGTTVVRAGASVMYSSFAAVYFIAQNGLSNTRSGATVASNPTEPLLKQGGGL